MDKETLKSMIREILDEEMGRCPVQLVRVPNIRLEERDRLSVENLRHSVFTRDLFSLSESPRLGCGIMEMEQTDLPWTLHYDEIDYVISGMLTVGWQDKEITAGPGDVLLIPKDTTVTFSAREKVRFLYVTHPADWNNQM